MWIIELKQTNGKGAGMIAIDSPLAADAGDAMKLAVRLLKESGAPQNDTISLSAPRRADYILNNGPLWTDRGISAKPRGTA
jgi:hypothetical protein